MSRAIFCIVLLLLSLGFLGFALINQPQENPPARMVASIHISEFEGAITLDGKPVNWQEWQDKTIAINMVASWCIACTAEAPVIDSLAKHLPVIAVFWRDEVAKSEAWLTRYGNPFALTIHDPQGTLGVRLGITGVPETLIFKNGVLVWRNAGGLSEALIMQDIIPLVAP